MEMGDVSYAIPSGTLIGTAGDSVNAARIAETLEVEHFAQVGDGAADGHQNGHQLSTRERARSSQQIRLINQQFWADLLLEPIVFGPIPTLPPPTLSMSRKSGRKSSLRTFNPRDSKLLKPNP